MLDSLRSKEKEDAGSRAAVTHGKKYAGGRTAGEEKEEKMKRNRKNKRKKNSITKERRKVERK